MPSVLNDSEVTPTESTTVRTTQTDVEEKPSSLSRDPQTLSLSSREVNRYRAAYINMLEVEPCGSLGEFLDYLVRQGVEQLEQRHNGGQQWEWPAGGTIRSVAKARGVDWRMSVPREAYAEPLPGVREKKSATVPVTVTSGTADPDTAITILAGGGKTITIRIEIGN